MAKFPLYIIYSGTLYYNLTLKELYYNLYEHNGVDVKADAYRFALMEDVGLTDLINFQYYFKGLL